MLDSAAELVREQSEGVGSSGSAVDARARVDRGAATFERRLGKSCGSARDESTPASSRCGEESTDEESPANEKNASEKSTGDESAVAWQLIHEKLVGLARVRAGLDFEEAEWLLRARRDRVHRRVGCGSFLEYVERLFGYSPRVVHERLRVAEALAGLPELGRALRDGELGWSAVRELTRVAIAETEGEWLEAAREKTAREVERMVSGRVLGDRPTDACRAEARRHVLRFEVSATVVATFREAMAKLRREAGEGLDDDAALLLLARHVLEGPRQAGRASYQVVLQVCDQCGRGQQRAHGELLDVGAEAVAMAECDAQRVTMNEEARGQRVTADETLRAGKTHVSSLDAGSAHVDSSDLGSADLRSIEGSKPRQSRDRDAGADPWQQPQARATQSVPPALRRAVLHRDHGCCVFPGCRNATFVDVHHLRPRSEGGRHEPDNLITICSAHHLGVHEGRLRVERDPAGGLRFAYADGVSYGALRRPLGRAEARTAAFQALRALGFREGEVRQALARVKTDEEVNVERLVRAALGELNG